MGRWTQYDEDSYRLPEGVRRTGYDADTGAYSFNGVPGIPHTRYGVRGSIEYQSRTTRHHGSNEHRKTVGRKKSLTRKASFTVKTRNKPVIPIFRKITSINVPIALRSLRRAIIALSSRNKPSNKLSKAKDHFVIRKRPQESEEDKRGPLSPSPNVKRKEKPPTLNPKEKLGTSDQITQATTKPSTPLQPRVPKEKSDISVQTTQTSSQKSGGKPPISSSQVKTGNISHSRTPSGNTKKKDSNSEPPTPTPPRDSQEKPGPSHSHSHVHSSTRSRNVTSNPPTRTRSLISEQKPSRSLSTPSRTRSLTSQMTHGPSDSPTRTQVHTTTKRAATITARVGSSALHEKTGTSIIVSASNSERNAGPSDLPPTSNSRVVSGKSGTFIPIHPFSYS